MSRNFERLTDQFDARSADGQEFRIHVYTTMIEVGAGQPPVEGLKRACTAQGQVCNRVDEDTFEILNLGLRVRRI